ncbi:hypothetical protein [Sideroxydans sp. CL21]|uniref:hypothetical protein n=1 Tax=Sideroxydans sp. CL21 TaxID=2600596 RepID=UPI0012AA959E|nr:hypothetical protein [Sideroxydans sp. CL21]VVC84465.1 hypothetical protein [Sideroxydans sp. CL21]
MSSTLEKLQLMIVELFGIRLTEIELDIPLQYVGMDASNLEELRIFIEENYTIDMSVVEEEHHEVDIDMPAQNLKDLTLRQIASWVDAWINRDEMHPRHHVRCAKPS